MKKVCSICREEKDTICFNKNCRSKDGLSSWCRDCQCAYFRTWQEKNKERHKARARKYYSEHKDHTRDYRQMNKEKIVAYQQSYRAVMREYLNGVRRLKRVKERAKAAWDAVKQDRQQIKLDVESQLSLLQE